MISFSLISRFQYSFIDSVFHPSSQIPSFKASIDLTSRFLVLSDINRNVKSTSLVELITLASLLFQSMYILTIHQDTENNRAYFSSINAFTAFNSPSLSFAITAADQINRKISLNSSDEWSIPLEYLGEQMDFVTYGVKMYSIHTK